MNKKLDDLIRIEDAIKVLCRKICHPGVFCPDGYCVEIWDEFNDIERVDAVPVVRCKDCIHWGKFPVSTVLPQYHKCGMATYKSTKGDDFCSDGRNRDPEPLKRGKNMCNYKIFSKMLKEQLKKKGMTQKELAERIDTTEVSVSRYVSGQRIPKATVLLKIATALGVSMDYLLGVEEKGDDNG